jgi:photosystem II stability/assembly factor-like uncharacterized protein
MRVSPSFFCACLISIAGSEPLAAQGSTVDTLRSYWEPLPIPPAGTVQALARARDGTIWAGTGSGLYRSRNEGRSWQPAGLDGTMVMSLLAARSGTLLAGTYRQGVKRSTDGGRTWKDVGFAQNSHIGLAEDEGKLYVRALEGTGPDVPTGVFRSVDDGLTWSRSSLSDREVFSVSVPRPGVLYAGTGGGLRRSLDGGSTWTDANAGLPESESVSTVVAYGDLLLAGIGDPRPAVGPRGAMYRSADGGQSWQRSDDGLPELTEVSSLLVLADTVYAATGSFESAGRGIYRSVDGRAWLHSGLEDLMAYTLLATPGRRLLAGTAADAVFVSMDAGKSWLPSATGFRDWGVFGIMVDSAGRLLAADLMRVHLSPDRGQNWQPLLRRPTVVLIPGVEGLLIVGSSAGRIYRSTTSGAVWDSAAIDGAQGLVLDLEIGRDGRGLAAVAGERPYETTDGGRHWSQIPIETGPFWSTSVAITPSGARLVGTDRGVYRFAQSSWENVLTHRTFRLTQCGVNTLYAHTVRGLWRSTDGGRTWTEITEELRAQSRQPGILNVQPVLCLPGDRLLIGTLGDGVFASSDGGVSWRNVTAGLSSPSAVALAHDGRGTIYVGTSAGIYRSTPETLFAQ